MPGDGLCASHSVAQMIVYSNQGGTRWWTGQRVDIMGQVHPPTNAYHVYKLPNQKDTYVSAFYGPESVAIHICSECHELWQDCPH